MNRSNAGRPAAPVRIVHLGIGNFTRAHQAWYTEHAPDAADWGIAGFTGRSAAVADQLAPTEGLYHLMIQAPEGNRVELISSLSAVHASDDLVAWRDYFARPEVAIVTSTITEAGYRRGPDGGLATCDEDVDADLAALAADREASVSTAPAKLVSGLLARRAAGAGAITFVPCDNLSHNGEMVRRIITEAATRVDPTLVDWVSENVSFVTTMVDRITPRATDADLAECRELTGVDDPSLVVTEPFTEWVLSGEFPAGRPAWEAAGARFVADIEAFETRKLRLLNGAHTLMAYCAPLRGCETVRDAITHPEVRGWVDAWWEEAISTIDLPDAELASYRDALVARFENPRIRHLLAQIAGDGSQKVPIRIVPVLSARLQAGEPFDGSARAVAGWVQHLRGHGAPVTDALASDLAPLVAGDLASAVSRVLGWLGVQDEGVTQAVRALAEELV